MLINYLKKFLNCGFTAVQGLRIDLKTSIGLERESDTRIEGLYREFEALRKKLLTEPKEKWEDWTDVDKEYAFKKSLGHKETGTRNMEHGPKETANGAYLMEVFNLLEYTEEILRTKRDEIKNEVKKRLAKSPRNSENDPFQTLQGKATEDFGSLLNNLANKNSPVKLEQLWGRISLDRNPEFNQRWAKVQSLYSEAANIVSFPNDLPDTKHHHGEGRGS
eukprot:GHVN01104388.1.p1 GENE.GHVN01104388.1~~GHVN01104388.1.p1  ORF type:complete len:220 (+),score=19.75 GHVN01104388.1:446-1105(+)